MEKISFFAKYFPRFLKLLWQISETKNHKRKKRTQQWRNPCWPMNIYQSVVRLSCCPPPSSWVVCFLLFKPQIVPSISFFVFEWWNADILDIITTPTKTGSAVSAEPLKRLNQMNHEIVHILWFFVGWVSCVLLWFVGHMLCPSVRLYERCFLLLSKNEKRNGSAL